MERTLCLIKPNAVLDGHIGHVIARFEEEGLRVLAMKMLNLSKEKAEGFYIEHKERPFFAELLNFMTSAPIVLLVLSGEKAVQRSREIMGATNPADAAEGTLRKLYAKSVGENAVHGSDSLASAEREINYFFEAGEIVSLHP